MRWRLYAGTTAVALCLATSAVFIFIFANPGTDRTLAKKELAVEPALASQQEPESKAEDKSKLRPRPVPESVQKEEAQPTSMEAVESSPDPVESWRTSLVAFAKAVVAVAEKSEMTNASIAITRIREYAAFNNANNEQIWVVFKQGFDNEFHGELAKQFTGKVSWGGVVESVETDDKANVHIVEIEFPVPDNLPKGMEFRDTVRLSVPISKLPPAKLPPKGSDFTFRGELKKVEDDALFEPVWVLYGLGPNAGKTLVGVDVADVEALDTSVPRTTDGEPVDVPLTQSGDADQADVKKLGAAHGLTLKTPQVLRGHSAGITSVAFCSDGDRIASSSTDGSVRLWDLSDENRVSTTDLSTIDSFKSLLNPTMRTRIEATSVAFAPDGKQIAFGARSSNYFVLASGSGGFWLPLSDTPGLVGHWISPKAANALTGSRGPVNAVCFSPDGQRILSGGSDNVVRLWQAETGEQVTELKGHSEAINSVAFSNDARLAISAGYDKTIRIWDLTTGKEVRTLVGHSEAVSSIAVSRDDQLLISGSSDKTVRVWQLADGKPLAQLRGHQKRVNSVSLSFDSKLAVSASDDKTVRLWDVSAANYIRNVGDHMAAVKAVAFSPDAETIVAGTDEGTIHLWAARDE